MGLPVVACRSSDDKATPAVMHMPQRIYAKGNVKWFVRVLPSKNRGLPENNVIGGQ